MKKTIFHLFTATLLAATFGCQKSTVDTSGNFGQRSSDQRLIIGNIINGDSAVFISNEEITAAFNASFTPLSAQKVEFSKNASDIYQLKIEAKNLQENSFVALGFALDAIGKEIMLATDQCIHLCASNQSACCASSLIFDGCAGSCLCEESEELRDELCTHTVSGGGGVPPIKGINTSTAVTELVKRLTIN